MYLSRLTFHTLPGKTEDVEEKLTTLTQWVKQAGGMKPRVMRSRFGSSDTPDLMFEQEVQDPAILEEQITKVTANKDFRQWSKQVAELLERSSKRELFKIVEPA